MAVVLMIVGLAPLVVGVEAPARGASRIAGAPGIPPLVIGLTVFTSRVFSPRAPLRAARAPWLFCFENSHQAST